MDLKKMGKAFLFPHMAIMLLLLPIATVFLTVSMVFLGTESWVAILSYVLAAYTLTVWCFRIPDLIDRIKRFHRENKYAIKWKSDTRLRINVSLYSALAWNILYGLFQLWLGFVHHTFWFYSIGAYYLSLAFMRFFLLCHTRRYAHGENRKLELQKYRACGWVFLVMNAALAVIVFFMLYWNRTFVHHMITTIAMAAYTFTAFTTAIVNLVKYKKYESPVFSATKAIGFAAACVSMLTLTSTMLTTFKDGTMDALGEKLMLGGVGFAVSGVVLVMAIYMIVTGTKKLRQFNTEV